MNTPSSMTVSADAQFTLAEILRPFDHFTDTYQGQDATIPIAMPGTLDPAAGQDGMSPYLLRGIPVPFGAKVQLWLPMALASVDESSVGYTYLLHWRLRNTADYVRRVLANGEAPPYHLAQALDGAQDTLLSPTVQNRIVIPSATESVLYQQTEPLSSGEGVGNLRSEEIQIPDDGVSALVTAGLPLLPPNVAPPFNGAFPGGGGNTTPLGMYQQGVLDPANNALAGSSIYRSYFTIAKGDDLIISVVRAVADPSTWDFATTDAMFAQIFTASPGLGVYLFTGTNPS